jgi:hypothetical protein
MDGGVRAQLYGLGVMLLLVGLGVVRRMRPQLVRPGRVAVSGVIIVAVVAASLAATGGRVVSDPIALALVPVFVAAGLAAGYYLVRSMTFWTDQAGRLWMRGGALFVLILLASIAVRLAVRGIAYGSVFGPGAAVGPATGFTSQSSASHRLLYDLSADLLFLSLGLWGARAYLLVQRYRAHLSGAGAERPGPVPDTVSSG